MKVLHENLWVSTTLRTTFSFDDVCIACDFSTERSIRLEFQYFAKFLLILRYTLNIFKVSLRLSLESVLESLRESFSLANSIANSRENSLANSFAESLAKNIPSLGKSLGSNPMLDSHQDSLRLSPRLFFSARES